LVIWNPDHLGERGVSEKKLRKSVRSAQRAAEAKLDTPDENDE
jgi:hypothetical protein